MSDITQDILSDIEVIKDWVSISVQNHCYIISTFFLWRHCFLEPLSQIKGFIKYKSPFKDYWLEHEYFVNENFIKHFADIQELRGHIINKSTLIVVPHSRANLLQAKQGEAAEQLKKLKGCQMLYGNY